jgi:hypothetical protein
MNFFRCFPPERKNETNSPPASPRAPFMARVVALCVERADGGRGVAVVMPHFVRNGGVEDTTRTVILKLSLRLSTNHKIPAGWRDARRISAGSVRPSRRRSATFITSTLLHSPVRPRRRLRPRVCDGIPLDAWLNSQSARPTGG